jgi:hypothetical protein
MEPHTIDTTDDNSTTIALLKNELEQLQLENDSVSCQKKKTGYWNLL